jgi:C_GCAxxG_C_C family probable redox protein
VDSQREEAIATFISGCACSQAVFSTYGPLFGVGRHTALRIATGFASGMRVGETCGAVTGAYMVLGLALCGADCDKIDGRRFLYETVKEFNRRFLERNSSLQCTALLGCNPSTPEGNREATEKGLFRSLCPKFVGDAAEIVADIMTENGK